MAIEIDEVTLKAFRARTLAPADMLRVDRQMRRSGPGSAARPADFAVAERLLRRVVADGAHPGYEQFEALIDGRAEPMLQARVEAHILWCGRCADELADLQRHAPTLALRLPRREPRQAGDATARTGWLARWLPARAPGMSWAGAALIAVLALGVVVQEQWRMSHDANGGVASFGPDAAPAAIPGAAAFDVSAWDAIGGVSPEASTAYRRGDLARAANALRPLADRGNPLAAECLALLLAQGAGVPRDVDAAAHYLAVAARGGRASARSNLEALARSRG